MKPFWELAEHKNAQDKGTVIARFKEQHDAEEAMRAFNAAWYDQGYQYSLKEVKRAYL